MKELFQNSNNFEEVKNVVLKFIKEYLANDIYNIHFYKHPLGFIYTRIVQEENEQIRMHIWTTNYEIKEDLFIHNHYYDLKSWILCGDIQDFTYELEKNDDNIGLSKYIGNYSKSENYRYLKLTDEFYTILSKSSKLLTAGCLYSINKEKFHSNKIIFNNSNITCTLVYTFNSSEKHEPIILGVKRIEKIIEETPQLIQREDIKIILLQLLDEIEKSNYR